MPPGCWIQAAAQGKWPASQGLRHFLKTIPLKIARMYNIPAARLEETPRILAPLPVLLTAAVSAGINHPPLPGCVWRSCSHRSRMAGMDAAVGKRARVDGGLRCSQAPGTVRHRTAQHGTAGLSTAQHGTPGRAECSLPCQPAPAFPAAVTRDASVARLRHKGC